MGAMHGCTTPDTEPVQQFAVGGRAGPSVEPFDWDIFHFQLNQAAERFEARLQGSVAPLLARELDPPLRAFREEIEPLTRQLATSGHALVLAQNALARDLRLLAWKTLAAGLTGALLLITGTTWIAYGNMRLAQEARLDAQSSRVLRQVRIASCDGRPCVRLEPASPRWGKDRDHLLLAP